MPLCSLLLFGPQLLKHRTCARGALLHLPCPSLLRRLLTPRASLWIALDFCLQYCQSFFDCSLNLLQLLHSLE